jgi:hypothetical protein
VFYGPHQSRVALPLLPRILALERTSFYAFLTLQGFDTAKTHSGRSCAPGT